VSPLVGAALQGVLPGFVAGLLVAWSGRGRWLPAAFPIGLLGAYALLKHWPPWPWDLARGSNDGTQWVLWSVAAAAVLGVAGAGHARRARDFALGAAVLVTQTWLLLTNLRARWTPTESVVQVAGSALVLVASFAIASRVMAPHRCTPNVVRVLFAALVLDGVVLAIGGSFLLAQLAGAIAAVVAGVLATGRKVAPPTWARAALPLASAHGGLLLAGHHFAEPELWTVLAAALLPAAAFVAR